MFFFRVSLLPVFTPHPTSIAPLFFSLYFSLPKKTQSARYRDLFSPYHFWSVSFSPRRPTRSQRTILLRGVRCSFLLLLWLFDGTTFFYALSCRKRKPAASPQRCSLQNSWRGRKEDAAAMRVGEIRRDTIFALPRKAVTVRSGEVSSNNTAIFRFPS